MNALSHFPTILPFEQSSIARVKIQLGDIENILQDCYASEAPLSERPEIDVETEIASLESSAKSLELAAAAIRRRLGRLAAIAAERAKFSASIARLPTDILRIVFQDAIDETVDGYDARRALTHPNQRLRLGQVCRSWRQIYFDIPGIWGNLLFDMSKYHSDPKAVFGLILPLTQLAPLNVDLRFGLLGIPAQTIAHTLRRAWRILGAPSNEIRTLITDILSLEPLPYLQTAILYAMSSVEHPNPELPMAEHLNLRFLTMTNIYMRPPQQGKLVRLDVDFDDCPWERGRRPTMDMLLDVLACNPTLQFLSLARSFIEPQSQRASPRILLPALTTLNLVHDDMASSSLMDCICAPAIAKASIFDYDESISVDSALRVIASTISAWATPRSWRPQCPSRETVSDELIAIYCVDVAKTLENASGTLSSHLAELLEETNVSIRGGASVRFDAWSISYRFERTVSSM